MRKSEIYGKYAKKTTETVSIEEIEERIEQSAREEEADNIVLAEDKRV